MACRVSPIPCDDPVRYRRYLLALGVLLAGVACGPGGESEGRVDRSAVEHLVHQLAVAWETGDTTLLKGVLHESARLAYPRRRVDRATWVQELDSFSQTHTDTRIYVHQITVDGQDFAVEWQFATTDRGSGTRTVVSDAIIGRVQDGRIILWKEYLDGRVPILQREGQLHLEEGEEPFPWPLVR